MVLNMIKFKKVFVQYLAKNTNLYIWELSSFNLISIFLFQVNKSIELLNYSKVNPFE